MRLLPALIATGLLLIGCAKSEPAVQETLVIDVRSLEEWNAGHLDTAVHIPHTEIAQRIAQVAPDKSRPIALH